MSLYSGKPCCLACYRKWSALKGLAGERGKNLVQVGIGGWQAPRPVVKSGRERQTSIMTVTDCVEMGIENAAKQALEVVWDGVDAVWLSFDVDCWMRPLCREPADRASRCTMEHGHFLPQGHCVHLPGDSFGIYRRSCRRNRHFVWFIAYFLIVLSFQTESLTLHLGYRSRE